MKKGILTLFILFFISGLYAQDYYYWYNGEQVFLTPYNNAKYLVINRDTLFSSELAFELALNNTSLTVDTIIWTNLETAGEEVVEGGYYNVLDTSYTEKQRVFISSSDSIDETVLANNSLIQYVGPYFVNAMGDPEGITDLFYVELYNENDSILLDSVSNSNNVKIIASVNGLSNKYILECTKHSAGNALEMANLFYETELFASSTPEITSLVYLFPSTVYNQELVEIELYPNPATDFVKIQNASKLEAIYVHNPQGVLVLMNNTNKNDTNYELDVSCLTPGNYYILGRGRNGIIFADELIVY
jgi:hypothetical protein